MMLRRKPLPQAPRVGMSHQGDLAVVACHFNWAGFKRPVENLRRFLRHMQWAGVPVYGYELQPEGRSFVTEGNPLWKRAVVGDQHMLFQKEQCINHIVDSLPPHITKIAWVDADLEFSNRDVFRVASSMLDTMACVQLFTEAVWTDHAGAVTTRRRACVLTGMDNRWLGHPGFAWAARRELFSDLGGLYSITPLGSGDTIFACAITGGVILDRNKNKTGVGVNTTAHDQWASRVFAWAKGRLGTVAGECWHMWHGDRKLRKYAQRNDALVTFDGTKHISISKRLGVLEWTHDTPECLKQYTRDYFINKLS